MALNCHIYPSVDCNNDQIKKITKKFAEKVNEYRETINTWEKMALKIYGKYEKNIYIKLEAQNTISENKSIGKKTGWPMKF